MEDYLFSFTPNHWADVDTTKAWVKKLLVPYLVKVSQPRSCSCQPLALACAVLWPLAMPRSAVQEKQRLQLPVDQRSLLLLDCWHGHIAGKFRSWMRQEYPWILVIYVPACCTGKLQPCDLAVNYVVKQATPPWTRSGRASCIRC
jgi:hypothetical protein